MDSALALDLLDDDDVVVVETDDAADTGVLNIADRMKTTVDGNPLPGEDDPELVELRRQQNWAFAQIECNRGILDRAWENLNLHHGQLANLEKTAAVHTDAIAVHRGNIAFLAKRTESHGHRFTKLEERVANIENWADAASAFMNSRPTAPPAQPQPIIHVDNSKSVSTIAALAVAGGIVGLAYFANQIISHLFG